MKKKTEKKNLALFPRACERAVATSRLLETHYNESTAVKKVFTRLHMNLFVQVYINICQLDNNSQIG